jgi:hypothetical protein
MPEEYRARQIEAEIDSPAWWHQQGHSYVRAWQAASSRFRISDLKEMAWGVVAGDVAPDDRGRVGLAKDPEKLIALIAGMDSAIRAAEDRERAATRESEDDR